MRWRQIKRIVVCNARRSEKMNALAGICFRASLRNAVHPSKVHRTDHKSMGALVISSALHGRCVMREQTLLHEEASAAAQTAVGVRNSREYPVFQTVYLLITLTILRAFLPHALLFFRPSPAHQLHRLRSCYFMNSRKSNSAG
jgi:hypothetical protein